LVSCSPSPSAEATKRLARLPRNPFHCPSVYAAHLMTSGVFITSICGAISGYQYLQPIDVRHRDLVAISDTLINYWSTCTKMIIHLYVQNILSSIPQASAIGESHVLRWWPCPNAVAPTILKLLSVSRSFVLPVRTLRQSGASVCRPSSLAPTRLPWRLRRDNRHPPMFVYYETTKENLKRRLTYECRCDKRLKVKTEGSTRLTYTGLRGGLEHLKIETRLIDERFASVMGECVILTPQVRRRHSK
jgi:hypothetical protein